jgi:putative sigma-54 modulation protein
MQFTIEHKDLELTDAIRSYAEEKMTSLEKYADIVKTDVEVGKSSGHHHHGEIFFCEAHVFVAGKDFFVKREEDDLYKAIDKVKDHLKNELTTWKDKHISEQRREGERQQEETSE